MKPGCTSLGCEHEAVVTVSGGARLSDHDLGWSGIYCEPHALRVVNLQFFQAKDGMPITIGPVTK